MIRHNDGTTDTRYSVTKEWCGQPEPTFVCRFCGEWLGFTYAESSAWAIGQAHQKERMYGKGLLSQHGIK